MNAKQWYVGNVAGGHHKTIRDENDPSGRDVVLVYEPDETADVIVRAVNSHADLIAAIERIADILKAKDWTRAERERSIAAWHEQARAALREAEAEAEAQAEES